MPVGGLGKNRIGLAVGLVLNVLGTKQLDTDWTKQTTILEKAER